MIGFFDYTVWLTYISMLSGTAGIMLCLNGIGHPYVGMFFLMFSGLCDAFDGKVARTKKNRTEKMKKFGIQIDSLADLICFGVLPACIGIAMMRVSISYSMLPNFKFLRLAEKPTIVIVILTTIAVLYVLAALIRLAYFNVMEEERQETEDGARKVYVGLPVTSSALIFPTILILHIFTNVDLMFLYFLFLAIVGFLFISEIQVRKPKTRDILIMVAIGAIEAIILIIVFVFLKR